MVCMSISVRLSVCLYVHGIILSSAITIIFPYRCIKPYNNLYLLSWGIVNSSEKKFRIIVDSSNMEYAESNQDL